MQKHLTMSTLNNRRVAEYQTYISKFINDIQGVNPTGIPEPLRLFSISYSLFRKNPFKDKFPSLS